MEALAPKLVWLLLAPANLITVASVLALLLWPTRWRRFARRLAMLVCLLLVLVATLPVGSSLLWVLESRFPTLNEPPPADAVAGIIVLGGAVDARLTLAHGQPALGSGAERMTETVALARRYPDLPVVFTGGDGTVLGTRLTEAQVAAMLFTGLGLPADRIRYEAGSRNTWENAVLTFERIKPTGDKPWLLVTSAAHIPRAVGCFRRAGWRVLAYPVDYQTSGPFGTVGLDLDGNLSALTRAVREWLGLAYYRLAGRIDALLPAPRDS
jgi:uncharacterized SAM-binding protein YcdF (DUF218 family)